MPDELSSHLIADTVISGCMSYYLPLALSQGWKYFSSSTTDNTDHVIFTACIVDISLTSVLSLMPLNPYITATNSWSNHILAGSTVLFFVSCHPSWHEQFHNRSVPVFVMYWMWKETLCLNSFDSFTYFLELTYTTYCYNLSRLVPASLSYDKLKGQIYCFRSCQSQTSFLKQYHDRLFQH